MIIGLIGGVAAGKSFVAKKLAAMAGAFVIDADLLAKNVVQEADVLAELVEAFGSDIVNSSGQLDRRALADVVFGDSPDAKASRELLNSIVHPKVRAKAKSMIALTLESQPDAWIVIDAPLLLEAGWGPSCDRILFVEATESFRKLNASKRGWDEDELEKREDSQMPIDAKRKAATDIIRNSGDEAELEAELNRWLRAVRGSET